MRLSCPRCGEYLIAGADFCHAGGEEKIDVAVRCSNNECEYSAYAFVPVSELVESEAE